MSERKKGVSALLDNKLLIAILSLAAAFILWVIVVFFVSPETERVIRDVPVNLNTSALQSLDLDIINREEFKVDVKVSGERMAVGDLSATSLAVYPRYTGISQSGTYDLVLVAEKVNPLDTFSIVSIEPATITLSFDNSESKTLTLEDGGATLAAQEGHIIDRVTFDPETIRVWGPQSEVARIDRAIVNYTHDEALNQRTTLNDLPITLLDANGNELSQTNLTLDRTTVNATIHVYKLGVLPIEIDYTNVPDGFDTGILDPVLSVTELEVAGTQEAIDNLTPRVVGWVDLSTFELGASYDFDIELSGLINLDVERLTVTFPREGISSKRIHVTDIRVENVPANYRVSLVTTRLNDVQVIGLIEDVESLLPGSVVAIVDMSEHSVNLGQSTVTVKFVITANNTTWVAGSYTVVIQAEAS